MRKKVNDNKKMKEKLCQWKNSEETGLLCFLRTLGNPGQIRVSNRIKGLTEPEILTRDELPHPNSLWKPIVWYWRTMQWKGEFSEEDETRLGGKCAPWLYLAFDFRAATMEKVTNMWRAEGEETLASLARTFHLASRRMLQRCQHKEKTQRNEKRGNNEGFGPSCLQRD